MFADPRLAETVVTDFSPFARVGAIALGGFFALFGAWALLVPISGAVISSGMVVNDGRVQVIRHETGGVVEAINVREGDIVTAGTVLAVLSPIDAQAALGQLDTRLLALDLRIARLTAERAGTAFDPASFAATNPVLLDQLLADQEAELSTRTARLGSELAVLSAQSEALARQRDGVSGEVAALTTQLASLAEDLSLRRAAAANGYGRAAQLRELEREHARLDGSLVSANASLAAIDMQRVELDNRVAALEQEFQERVAADLATARAERLELGEAHGAAASAVDRVEIRAPVDGIVSRLAVNTIGSAIEPYGAVAEIVPQGEPLVIEARVEPTDIDELVIGQTAEVVFAAFPRSEVDPVVASVEFISPASHADERTGAQFYTVRLSVPREELVGLPPLLPGMPAETYFRTADHTLAQYLVAPLLDSFPKAFR